MTNPKAVRVPTILGVALSGLLLGSVAQAHPPHELTQKLGLTEAQQQQLTELRREVDPNRHDRSASRKEIMELFESGNVDGAAELAAQHARDRVYRRAEMRRQLSEVLTPEQLEQFDALREARQHRGRRGKSPRGDRRDQ